MKKLRITTFGILFTAILALNSMLVVENSDLVFNTDLNTIIKTAFAQTELPGGGITCSSGDYGVCQWCTRTCEYVPGEGWAYCYDCKMSGLTTDFCPSSCEGCMSV